MGQSIDSAVLSRFTSLFVDERSHFHRRIIGTRPFAHHGSHLSDEVLGRHLVCDASWVAVLRAPETRILSLDLDAKHAELPGADPRTEMQRRYERICAAMPEPVVIQSSSSGGLHCYWWTDVQRGVPGSTQNPSYFRGAEGDRTLGL
jgi:hypothetical protein